ncbi:hypothetical protein PHLGIDRAFT_29476 [Phlebiopsis gigantea 11061_1 CR5-6]|uniref:Pinin/SDK/MemA protein domain-containing protein n=1 Tax=Phlebiopsis gigantea (strain 11061_1 CR5-6) TaxID=745531 RepID=A0A0C3S9Y3_PHLG1|nr:hypothetical protein PHLGIDRAFT_29476 [Phlebiopsis gigantea 11061_1 CR5-6]
MQDAASPTAAKKRPRLDLAADPRERKRGKTMFGLVLGTLNKAKLEDSQRNNSEAARKRQLIEQRLQDKLRKETDSVRRAEEAKKDKTSANRREEELQLKDSIHKLRRTRLPLLANFLSTTDRIPTDDSELPSPSDPLALPPRSHPPPLYYLPAILLPRQEDFLKRRKAEVTEAAEKEWESFKVERAADVEEISKLRQRVAEEEERKRGERKESASAATDGQDVKMEEAKTPDHPAAESEPKKEEPAAQPAGHMDVDDESSAASKSEEKTETPNSDSKSTAAATLMQAAAGDEDDAVEY